MDCYLLDNNGFIIASEKPEDTGRFFGRVRGSIMELLVNNSIYKKIRIFDYQAVCLDAGEGSNVASVMTTVSTTEHVVTSVNNTCIL